MAVLALLLGRHLAKRLPRPGHKEDRVIAKSRLAAPLGDDLASAFAFEELRLTIGRRQRDHAHKARQPRPRHTVQPAQQLRGALLLGRDRKSTRLNSSHMSISYAVFCLKKKKILALFSEYKKGRRA